MSMEESAAGRGGARGGIGPLPYKATTRGARDITGSW